jgi:hypothetical protein
LFEQFDVTGVCFPGLGTAECVNDNETTFYIG